MTFLWRRLHWLSCIPDNCWQTWYGFLLYYFKHVTFNEDHSTLCKCQYTIEGDVDLIISVRHTQHSPSLFGTIFAFVVFAIEFLPTKPGPLFLDTVFLDSLWVAFLVSQPICFSAQVGIITVFKEFMIYSIALFSNWRRSTTCPKTWHILLTDFSWLMPNTMVSYLHVSQTWANEPKSTDLV